MWLVCFSILVTILVWQSWAAGPRRGLGAIVVLSLLVPSWVILEVAGLPVRIATAASIFGLVWYCLHPKATFNLRVNLVDIFGLMLLGVHVVSDWTNDGFNWTVPLRAYGEWAVPYLAGRLALQSIDDVRGILPFVVVVSTVLATISTIESLTQVNVFEVVFGIRPIDHTPRDLRRFGLRRSYGPTINPIFFGVLQVLLFAWAVYAAGRARRGEGLRWWHVAPWLNAVGVFFTLSRAPQLAVGIIVYATALIAKPNYRKWLIGLGAAGIVGGVIAWPTALRFIHLIGDETHSIDKRRPTVIIENEKLPSSSVLSRVYFFDVYGLAMRRAGLLGFGTDRTTGFPPRVPIGPQHVETMKRIWTVDNSYIVMVLRFGYLGLACFVCLGMAAIAAFLRLSWLPRGQGQLFFAGMAGTLFATMLMLLTVYMPHDFGFWYLWSVGTASGLCGWREGKPRPVVSRH